MTKYMPAEGDEVEVVLRSKVLSVNKLFFTVGQLAYANAIYPDAPHVVSVKRMIPEMPEFGRGDVIRIKAKYDSVEHIAVRQQVEWACSCGNYLDDGVVKFRWNWGDITILLKDGKPVAQ